MRLTRQCALEPQTVRGGKAVGAQYGSVGRVEGRRRIVDDDVAIARGQDQRRGSIDSSRSGDALKNKSHPSVASALQQLLCSAPCRNRTYNLVIKSHLLCQLS